MNREKTGFEPAPPQKIARPRTGTDRLTDRTIAAWIRGGMVGKLSDGQAMYLVAPSAVPVWRIKYRRAGIENTYTIGRYGSGADEFTLARARAERGTARAWLDAGLDPNVEKRAERARATAKQGETFSKIAAEWLDKNAAEWSRTHVEARRRLIERDLLPALGALPIADLAPAEILAVLQRIEARGAHEVAAKARIVVSMICRYAVITGRRQDDPAQHLGDALRRPPVKNRATIPLDEMEALFAAVDAVPAESVTKLALYWLILTAARSSEMRFATWGEIEGGKLWRITAERMKMRNPHVVPLSRQAQAILAQAAPLRTSAAPDALIFPGFSKHGALSEGALLSLLARAGFYGKQSAHGFRASLSTWAHEVAEADPDVIEACLAHVKEGVRGIYNRASYLSKRRELLQAWADQCTAWGMRLP